MKISTSIFVYYFFFIVNNLLSQNLSSIGGNVFDAATKEFLPGATVYLANTAIGVVANNDGSFLLDKITPGKYDLIISMVGYKTLTKLVLANGHPIVGLVIYLTQEVKELNSVEVTSKKKKNSRTDFTEFKRYFLGQTKNSSRCEIINIHDIFVYKDGPRLYAVSHKPIEILNKALGYRIIYEMKEFVIDHIDNIGIVEGITRFENLVAENKKQEARWTKERDRAYYGSMEHFIRSFKKRELKKNRFSLFDMSNKELDEQKLLKTPKDSVMCYKGSLKLFFDGERAEFFYNPKGGRQESVLKFDGRPIAVYDNGNYHEFKDILLFGYLGWSSKISEIVPFGYQPTTPLK